MVQSVAHVTPDVMDVKDLARYLKFSPIKIYRLVEEGVIPARKIGRQYRFVKSLIDEWLSLPMETPQEAVYFSKRDKHAKKYGLDKMSMRDIDAEVSEVRKRR